MKDPEAAYVDFLTGGQVSPLMTDGYKFSMAQAGFPLRTETFTLSCRKGGPFYTPFNLGKVIQVIVGNLRLPELGEYEWLARHDYAFTSAMKEALQADVEVWSPPVGSWVNEYEPLLTVTGPSFLASWLEPLAIMLNFPLQVATAYLDGKRTFRCSCSHEAEIVKLVATSVGGRGHGCTTDCNEGPYRDTYRDAVQQRVLGIVKALGGEGHRAFEVGLRAATCLEMHNMALDECMAAGIFATSNVYGASISGGAHDACPQGMKPVGTTGHEHQQRWGADIPGYRAVRDMRASPPSYLPDTYDVMNKGLPGAFRVLKEEPGRKGGIRLDADDQEEERQQFALILGADLPDQSFVIFEGGYDAPRTAETEAHCDEHGWPQDRRFYGYGGYIVCAADWMPYTRNRVSCVYKLSRSGDRDVMKFTGAKSSVPGKPCILRPADNYDPDYHIQWGSLIAQQGETVEGFRPIQAGDRSEPHAVGYSPATQRMIYLCRKAAGLPDEVFGAVPPNSEQVSYNSTEVSYFCPYCLERHTVPLDKLRQVRTPSWGFEEALWVTCSCRKRVLLAVAYDGNYGKSDLPSVVWHQAEKAPGLPSKRALQAFRRLA